MTYPSRSRKKKAISKELKPYFKEVHDPDELRVLQMKKPQIFMRLLCFLVVGAKGFEPMTPTVSR
jgi:hypothetical protein